MASSAMLVAFFHFFCGNFSVSIIRALAQEDNIPVLNPAESSDCLVVFSSGESRPAPGARSNITENIYLRRGQPITALQPQRDNGVI